MVLRDRLQRVRERLGGDDGTQRRRESAITRNAREDAAAEDSGGITSRAVQRLKQTPRESDAERVRGAARRAGAGAGEVARRGAAHADGVDVRAPRGTGSRKERIAKRAQEAAMVEPVYKDATLDPASPEGMDEFAAVGSGPAPDQADESGDELESMVSSIGLGPGRQEPPDGEKEGEPDDREERGLLEFDDDERGWL